MKTKILETAFLEHQIQSIREHVLRANPHTVEEAQRAALEWIERHAAENRANWSRMTRQRAAGMHQ